VTATTAELNFVDGVTSNVQTQLNTKAPLASPTFTGTATVSGNLTVDGGTIKLDGNYPVGTGNVALGDTALGSVEAGGNYNVAIGGAAGTAITTGDHNVAIGFNALDAEDGGTASVAIGSYALSSQNADGNNFNTAVGYVAGSNITTGAQNTLVGALAGDAFTDADYNVALGYEALTVDTLGGNSVAIGAFALRDQNFTSATNAYNVGIGYEAGGSITTGVQNTIVGGLAGDLVTTGLYNTILGYDSGSSSVNLTTGNGNVLVGSFAHTGSASDDYANGIGYDINASGGYTTIGKGVSDIRAQHGVATWATVSDERYKKDIVDSTTGLSFINALRPRTFKYRTLGELPETFRAYEAGSTEVFKNSNTNHGFIAQEIKAAIDADASIKDGFRLWDDRDDGSQEVAEAALIPVLVKAVQELSAKNDALEARITTLEG
jgi:trimeric autotransporter adhesin